MFSPRLFLSSCLGLVLASSALPSLASQVSVSPVRVDLSKASDIVPVNVYNQGDEVVVMETSMRIWNQSPSGQWLLSPTQDIKAYPGLIRIQPKSSAVVRVGMSPSATLGAKQGTYRLFLRELADPRPEGGANVRIVLNINLPVFVAGADGSRAPLPDNKALTAVGRGGVVNFTYKNPKTSATLSPQTATYLWLDAAGKTLATTPGKIDAYALPGGVGRWNHALPLQCQKIASVSIKGDAGMLMSVPLSCSP